MGVVALTAWESDEGSFSAMIFKFLGALWEK
jgi:hypothetical protein